jgi:hypothetical protein
MKKGSFNVLVLGLIALTGVIGLLLLFAKFVLIPVALSVLLPIFSPSLMRKVDERYPFELFDGTYQLINLLAGIAGFVLLRRYNVLPDDYLSEIFNINGKFEGIIGGDMSYNLGWL